jgi:hypothetical protein
VAGTADSSRTRRGELDVDDGPTRRQSSGSEGASMALVGARGGHGSGFGRDGAVW